ncbi:hypothetical protein ElyMa_000094000 [Elysia marginata]|uniref:C1q domain-containing protein n=1 Tax=Elysia marginata TaxID=1093978 RepID=A0AAV4EK37_9GAST|nr:hypothetical protein ElyMa_000094000 [Elysia marginata]
MGETQSKPNLDQNGSKNLEMVSRKVTDLKGQGEKLSAALFAKVDELGVECQKALEASNNNSHVASIVAYRLDSFSELLDNAMLKLQGHESSPSQTSQAIKAKLDGISAALFKSSSDSEKEKENVKNLQMFALDNARLSAQLKKMRSRHKALKQQLVSVKDEKNTAILLLSKKVSSLEKLRNLLTSGQARAEASTPELKQMCQNTQLQLQKLETDISKFARPPVGFTAQLQEDRDIGENCQVKRLFKIVTGTGDCFKPYQGHFVVPYDGLYCFCVKLEQQNNICFTASLMSREAHEEADEEMQIPMHNDSPHSALCVLELTANKRVFVKIVSSDDEIALKNTFTFSGWSIGYY